MAQKNILPPTYFNSALALIIILHFIFPIVKVSIYPWNLIGILPVLFGIYLNLRTDRIFKKVNTTVKPFEEPRALITVSTFRFTRNPMYLGMSLILLGLCILLGSLSGYLILLIFVLVMDLKFIKSEETMLSEKFKSDWQVYRKKVRRWL